MDLGKAFDGIIKLLAVLIVLCTIFVPLGIWKLIELIIWFCHYVHVHMS
jgi:hypothetical protein